MWIWHIENVARAQKNYFHSRAFFFYFSYTFYDESNDVKFATFWKNSFETYTSTRMLMKFSFYSNAQKYNYTHKLYSIDDGKILAFLHGLFSLFSRFKELKCVCTKFIECGNGMMMEKCTALESFDEHELCLIKMLNGSNQPNKRHKGYSICVYYKQFH